LALIHNIKQQQDLIIAEFNDVLKQMSDVLGIDCKIRDLRVHGDSGTFYVDLQLMHEDPSVEGAYVPVSKYEFDWDNKCKKHLVPKEILHKKYRMSLTGLPKNRIYEVLGIYSTRKQKYPVIIQDTLTKKIWKVSVDILIKHSKNGSEVSGII